MSTRGDIVKHFVGLLLCFPLRLSLQYLLYWSLSTHKHHKYKTIIRIHYSRKREIQLHIWKGCFQEWPYAKSFFRRTIIRWSGLWFFLVFIYFIISHVDCKTWCLRTHMGREFWETLYHCAEPFVLCTIIFHEKHTEKHFTSSMPQDMKSPWVLILCETL